MSRQLPSVRQLSYLLALEQHGHFGRAASASFVSQSAFSTAIRQLEELLGVQLFERDNRRVRITPMGRELTRQAREVMDALERLRRTAQGSGKALEGRLSLGVIPTVAPFLVPRLIPGLQRRFPGLELMLTEDRTETLHRRLLDGEFDLLLLALPWVLPGTEQLTLLHDPFHLVGRRGSDLLSLAARGLGRLPAGSIMLLEEGHCLRDHALDACRLRGRGLRDETLQSFAATSIHTLLQMVVQGLGLTLLPQMALNDPMVRALPIDALALDGEAGRDIGLVWRRGSAAAEEFGELGEAIRELAETG